ncbi:MAG: MFS transporter, partial [Chloroflexi bacterium]|nr:MFS transporter [Chloroflexota bacterium]
TMISVTGSMAREEGAIEGPVVGWLMDRVGPRVTSALGWLIAGTGFLILPLIYWLPRENNVWWMWLGYGAMVTIGANAALYNTSYKAINRWFIKNRALAIGMASWGSGFGSLILIPVTAYGVATYGWAPTVTAIGSLFIVMGMVSALLLFRRNGPEADGFFPDNEIPVIQAPKVTGEALAVPKVALKDYSALEALKDRSF